MPLPASVSSSSNSPRIAWQRYLPGKGEKCSDEGILFGTERGGFRYL